MDLEDVFKKLLDLANENADSKAVIEEEVNNMLDELWGQDFFGTEGQLDPRGDHRNKDW